MFVVGIPPIKLVMNGGWFMPLLYQHQRDSVTMGQCHHVTWENVNQSRCSFFPMPSWDSRCKETNEIYVFGVCLSRYDPVNEVLLVMYVRTCLHTYAHIHTHRHTHLQSSAYLCTLTFPYTYAHIRTNASRQFSS